MPESYTHVGSEVLQSASNASNEQKTSAACPLHSDAYLGSQKAAIVTILVSVFEELVLGFFKADIIAS